MHWRALLTGAILGLAASRAAWGLALPDTAMLAAERVEPTGRIALPTEAWRDDATAMLDAEGEVTRQAWQVPGSDLTTSQLLKPLLDELNDAGYRILFECQARECGGFEFRYGLGLLPEPEMHVDLGDFQYVLAKAGGKEDGEVVSLLASRSSARGFIHVTIIRPVPQAAAERPQARPSGAPGEGASATEDTRIAPAVTPGGLAGQFESSGRAILGDLTFETGSAQLQDRPFASLNELADYLAGHPEAQVVLVGHTDAQGALAANIDLSKRRAAAVRDRLVEAHGISAARLSAEGVGFLLPLAPNDTEAGRARNRRVEAVLRNTE